MIIFSDYRRGFRGVSPRRNEGYPIRAEEKRALEVCDTDLRMDVFRSFNHWGSCLKPKRVMLFPMPILQDVQIKLIAEGNARSAVDSIRVTLR